MRVPPSSPFLSNTAYISRMMHTPTVPRFQPAILILDVSHDIGISDIPLNPFSKGGRLYLKNSPLEEDRVV
ncbi:hypothetical protein DAMNIGENAA_33980 [Desulforhabdus amnigena]|uniref:Uncharacterized protein n=1 Tax=Desulforhabdus amnigena TaxID=40218 RepID=A0A9W6FW40_9BACT|nr:hypothetical protein DAMNIGENAA_33980 [Desulforhabdus amnigena]